MNKAIDILTNYLRCASISADPAYAQGVVAAREYVAQLLEDGGFAVEIVPTPLHAIVFAQRLGDPSWPHVVLYGHYDVQPVDPLELWESDPFEPVERDGRIYARGATDQKGPFVTMFTGLMDAIEAAQGALKLNITVIVEGEEEIGSPSFRGFLKDYAPRLRQADCVILSDTISPSSEQIAIATGLRGLVALEILFEGPSHDVHSGFYGGAVANPLHALMAVGASLHDASGRVTVPGFYEAVKFPQAWEREELKRYPMTLAALQKIVEAPALAPTPTPFESPLEMLRFAPTLEFNGLGGGYQGPGSKTIIPSRAQAKITCRLVPDQDPKTIAEAVAQTLQARCPQGIRCSVSYGEGGLPYRVTPPQGQGEPKTFLGEAFLAAQSAIEQAFGKKPVFLPEGGSIPIIADLKAFAGLDSLMIGLALPQDNMHSPNESFLKKQLERGAQAYSMLFKKLASS